MAKRWTVFLMPIPLTFPARRGSVRQKKYPKGMGKMKKKLFSVALAVLLIGTLATLSASAATVRVRVKPNPNYSAAGTEGAAVVVNNNVTVEGEGTVAAAAARTSTGSKDPNAYDTVIQVKYNHNKKPAGETPTVEVIPAPEETVLVPEEPASTPQAVPLAKTDGYDD